MTRPSVVPLCFGLAGGRRFQRFAGDFCLRSVYRRWIHRRPAKSLGEKDAQEPPQMDDVHITWAVRGLWLALAVGLIVLGLIG